MKKEDLKEFESGVKRIEQFDILSFALSFRDLYHYQLYKTPLAPMAETKVPRGSSHAEWKRAIEQVLADKLQVLSHIGSSLAYVEELLEHDPDRRKPISDKIKQLKELYSALSDFGLMPATNAVDDYMSAWARIATILAKISLFTYEHQTVQEEMLIDPATTMVLSFGSGANLEQIMPGFAVLAAKDGEEVSVYNFDRKIHPSDKETVEVALYTRANPRIQAKLLDCDIFFPSDLETKSMLGLDNIDAQRKKIIADYVAVLLDKKLMDPNFKLVLLDSRWHTHDRYTLEFIKKLLDTGLFVLGKDFEFVHNYFDHSPAIVYRDFNKISKVNKVLEPEERLHSPDYNPEIDTANLRVKHDTEHDMYVFPRLQYVGRLFVKDLEIEKKSALKLRMQ